MTRIIVIFGPILLALTLIGVEARAQSAVDLFDEPLSPSNSAEVNPAVSGERAVFESLRAGSADILLLNGDDPLGFLASGPNQQSQPRIDGDSVVWTDENATGGTDIIFYDLKTFTFENATQFPNAVNLEPDISGSLVAYTTSATGTREIYVWDSRFGVPGRLVATPDLDRAPTVSGNRVVWIGSNQLGIDRLLTGVVGENAFEVIDDSITPLGSPSFSGDRVAYIAGGQIVNNTVYQGSEIRLIDTTDWSVVTLPIPLGDRRTVVLDGSYLYYDEVIGGTSNIFFYDVDRGGTPQPLLYDSTYDDFLSDAEGTQVAFVTNRRAGIFDARRLRFRINEPPQIAASGPKTVPLGQSASLAAEVFDPDSGPELTLAWSVLESPPGSNPQFDDPAAASPIFSGDVVGSYVIELNANDGYDPAPPDFLIIDVLPPATNISIISTVVTRDPHSRNIGRIALWSDLVADPPLPDDLVSVRYDGIVLSSVPFSAYSEGSSSGRFTIWDNGTFVRLDFALGEFVAVDQLVSLAGLDVQDGATIELMLGDRVASETVKLGYYSPTQWAYIRGPSAANDAGLSRAK